MIDLSKYGITVKKVDEGVYHVKGLLVYRNLIYNKNEDVVIPSNKTLVDYKARIEHLYGADGLAPTPARYEKFMAVIEYLEGV